MSSIFQIFILNILIMTSTTFFDFSDQHDLSQWKIQNDTVMGGQSNSRLVRNEAGNGVFKGKVSLENNGGFAMVQYYFESWSVSKFSKVLLQIKGDGKRYQFRIKNQRNDRHSYIQYFETIGDWETIAIPLEDMTPWFRGRKPDQSNFRSNQIEGIAFLIGNGEAQDFRLEIDKIMFE